MSFQEIKGHDRVIKRFAKAIEQGHLAGAYLFQGPSGVGKNLFARTLAKALNCEEKVLDPCDKCASCLKIDKTQHPDVHLIDLQDSDRIKIEYIRQLQRDINLKPYEGRKKVFIIDEAHKLTPEASNALLKVLEEPPKHSLIILITSKPALLFKTIISRCQVIKFCSLPRESLEELLRNKYYTDKDASHFLAYFCEGRLGEAVRLSATDIMRRKNRIIDEVVFPQEGHSYRDSFSQTSQEDMHNRLLILAAWFRDVYLVKSQAETLRLINNDRKGELSNFAKRVSFEELDGAMHFISGCIFYLEHNINVKLLMSNLRAMLWKE